MISNDRKSPRYFAQLQVKIDDLPLSTINISLDGTQLSCNRMIGDILQKHIKNSSINILLSLNDNVNIKIKCEEKYFSIYDDSEYLIGLEFIEFHDDSRKILETFISENSGHLLRLVK
jgi:hypothetical protein